MNNVIIEVTASDRLIVADLLRDGGHALADEARRLAKAHPVESEALEMSALRLTALASSLRSEPRRLGKVDIY
jgi:hypothetical protein